MSNGRKNAAEELFKIGSLTKLNGINGNHLMN